MTRNIVKMPIKYLYVNNVKLRDIFEISEKLLKLHYEYDVDVNFKKFYLDVTKMKFLKRFNDSNGLFKHCIKKYAKIRNIKNSFWYDVRRIDDDTGDCLINLDTFMFFNEILYPDLLEIHMRCYQKNYLRKYEADIGICFSKRELCFLYDTLNFEDALDDFLDDLSLYLSYNEIGDIMSPEDIEFYQDDLKIKVQLGI